MWPVVQTVRTLFIQSSNDKSFVSLLQEILPDTSYAVCPQIADFNQRYSAIHRDVQGLQHEHIRIWMILIFHIILMLVAHQSILG